jgi:Fe2+ transport system protein FeoA
LEKRLSKSEPGERGVVTRVECAGVLRRGLLDMGLVKGTEITAIRRHLLETRQRINGYENKERNGDRSNEKHLT